MAQTIRLFYSTRRNRLEEILTNSPHRFHFPRRPSDYLRSMRFSSPEIWKFLISSSRPFAFPFTDPFNPSDPFSLFVLFALFDLSVPFLRRRHKISNLQSPLSFRHRVICPSPQPPHP